MVKRVLLTSVFKPFGIDNQYGRKDSKIELYHNQLTKAQSIYSMRAFMPTIGLHVIANNLEVPVTVLDYPTLKRFRREIKKGYDVVGIGANLPNFQKVKKMVEEIRSLSPESQIVLGGFCSSIPDVREKLGVDHVCVGEGIAFMRDLLGLPPDYQFRNPDISAKRREIFGVPMFGAANPYVVVGLGCSYGCEFCSTSHFFNKRHIKFYKQGPDLLTETLRVKKRFNTPSICYIGDDNFLIDLSRAEQLRRSVIESNQVLDLMIFASADKVAEFGPEKLAEAGIGIVWIGREGLYSDYDKNRGADLSTLVAELRRFGIKTILSSILLLEKHTKENIEEEIDDHIACRPAFSQFAYYAPLPGTPLYERMNKENRILTAIPFEEWHGFKQPWFIHPEFDLPEAERIQRHAYQKDFTSLGPSILRYIEADLEGFRSLKDSGKSHLRTRAGMFASRMKTYKILLKAMEYLAHQVEAKELVREVLNKVEGDFGRTPVTGKLAARVLFLTGRFREFRTRHWGDVLQPRTQVVQYKNDVL